MRKIKLLILLVLILSLNTFGLISDTTKVPTDSVKISLSEGRNITLANEEKKQCQEEVKKLNTVIEMQTRDIENRDSKIANLYNTIDLNKDDKKLLTENNEVCELENKQLKKQIKREKLKLILVVAGAVIVQVITFKVLYL